MKHEDASREARLEQSLRAQVKPPRLDGRFDAAVWTRIAAEDQTARSRPPMVTRGRTPRWLLACNVIAVLATVALVGWAAWPVEGLDPGVELSLELPTFSLDQRLSFMKSAGLAVAAAALLYGFKYTRMGRRLLAQLR